MSRYKTAKDMGYSNEAAILFDAKSIVDEELKHLRGEMDHAELHTILANTRQDISAIAILLSGISSRQRRIHWLLILIIFLLGVIAVRV